MYSGFISTKRVLNRLGVHQRFDSAAHRMISPFLKPKTFPGIRAILHFEGYNGPDGIKLKSPGVNDPSHFYDPETDAGELPMHVESHYSGLVDALRKEDLIRAGFEASWLAHYVVDGLTPAHHYPLVEKIVGLREGDKAVKRRQATDEPLRNDATSYLTKNFIFSDTVNKTLKANWAIWGGKGILSTHHNFEIGVATSLLFAKLSPKLNESMLSEARQMGMMEFFKREAKAVARLDLYDRFYKEGWTAELARVVRQQIAAHACQVVGIIWILAYLEAGQVELTKYKGKRAVKK
jgi:hypothetical protein